METIIKVSDDFKTNGIKLDEKLFLVFISANN